MNRLRASAHSVRLLAGLATTMGVAAGASANVYTYNLGSFGPFDNTTGVTHNFAVSTNGPVRGYYVSGAWTRNTGTSASSLMRTTLNDGTTTWAAAHMGGNTSTAVTSWQFGQFSNRANNSAFNDPNTPAGGLTGDIFSGSANANYSIKFTSGSSTMTASMANSSVTLMTDAIAPFSGDLTGATTVYRRASNLTTLATAGNYRYRTHSFVAPFSGTYMIAGNWVSPTAAYDGHLNLYEGTFDPGNALTNLVGVDDDAMPVPPNTSGLNSSAMWLNLTAGQNYTIVATQFTAAAVSNPYNIYVAGPVPEPATFAVLGLGAAALLRRRRK